MGWLIGGLLGLVLGAGLRAAYAVVRLMCEDCPKGEIE